MANSVARDSAPAIRRAHAKTPVHVRLFGDRIFNAVTFVLALFILALLFGLAIALIVSSFPAIRAFGLNFFISSTWDPVQDQYGALPFIYGTFVSSFLALIIAVPLSLGVGRVLVRPGLPPLNFYVAGQWTVYRQFAPITPQTTVNFGITVAFPEFDQFQW